MPCGALVERFNKRKDIDDITRSISLYREALRLRPPEHPDRDITLNNLALALQTRCDELDVSDDLNEAIDLYRESLQLRWLDHPGRHVTLYNLSSVLSSRFTHTRKNEDVEEAITLENSRLASGHPTQGFPNRIGIALRWVAEAESYQHESALEAYQAATAFSGAQSLPVDAASCAIRDDNLRRADKLMERGRGQQWSLASRLKTPVEDLESANPKLAHNYLELSKLISNAAQGSADSTDRAAADLAATKYRKLTEQWEAAVAEI
ncbi:hypothetical protein BDR05DRAFT_1004652, partial [Suillus weaverae]